MFERIRTFITLARTAQQIMDSEADWETKYDLVFSDEISVKIRSLDVPFSWYDPDTSYEEDVRAFVLAVNEEADRLEKGPSGKRRHCIS